MCGGKDVLVGLLASKDLIKSWGEVWKNNFFNRASFIFFSEAIFPPARLYGCLHTARFCTLPPEPRMCECP